MLDFVQSEQVDFEGQQIKEINALLWNFIKNQCPHFTLFYILMDYLEKKITYG